MFIHVVGEHKGQNVDLNKVSFNLSQQLLVDIGYGTQYTKLIQKGKSESPCSAGKKEMEIKVEVGYTDEMTCIDQTYYLLH